LRRRTVCGYAQPMTFGAARILVDGYNAIRRTARWNELFQRDPAAARAALLAHCAAWKAQQRGIRELAVFFDGDSTVAAADLPRPAGVRVVFTPSGTEADEAVIAALRQGAARSAAVVSDDREVARRARQLGAGVISAAEFAASGAAPPPPAPPTAAGKNGLTPEQRRQIDADLRRAWGVD